MAFCEFFILTILQEKHSRYSRGTYCVDRQS